MIAPLAPFDAYAEDVARIAGRTALGEHDDAWLTFAHVVCRLADIVASDAPTRELRAVVGEGDWLPRVEGSGALRRLIGFASAEDQRGMSAVVLDEANRIEEGGGFSLARVTLIAMRRLLPSDALLERGRLLAQEARVVRYAGDDALSADMFESVERLARRGKLPELRARADLGFGILALRRGDYPTARIRFKRALRVAQREGFSELLAGGHHSLLSAAMVAGDFDTALKHGWAAFRLIRGTPQREAEVLVNLGGVCSAIGHDAAAVSCFLRAAELTAVSRVRLPALTNVAMISARLGDRRLLEWCGAQVDRAIAHDVRPFERSTVERYMSEAWWRAGEVEKAHALFVQGSARANQYGYHELRLSFDEFARTMSQGPYRPAVAPDTGRAAADRIGMRARSALRELERLGSTKDIDGAVDRASAT